MEYDVFLEVVLPTSPMLYLPSIKEILQKYIRFFQFISLKKILLHGLTIFQNLTETAGSIDYFCVIGHQSLPFLFIPNCFFDNIHVLKKGQVTLEVVGYCRNTH